MQTTNSYNLIQRFTPDGLKLTGLFAPGDKSKTASIFIHGFTTDFYSHDFYHQVTTALRDKGNAVILAQTRGTGVVTEFLKTDGEGIFLGSYYEKLDDAHLDLSCFIEFLLQDGYKDIALIGHSLGTIKAVRYLFEGKHKDRVSKLVLLAPFDKNAFIEAKAPRKWEEFLTIAQKKVEEGRGREIVPVPEWEDFAMSYETFYSWYEQSDLSCVFDFYRPDYDFPILSRIRVPVKVIIGENDPFIAYSQFGTSVKGNMTTLKKYLKDCETVIIAGSGHTYFGAEDRVSVEVANFI